MVRLKSGNKWLHSGMHLDRMCVLRSVITVTTSSTAISKVCHLPSTLQAPETLGFATQEAIGLRWGKDFDVALLVGRTNRFTYHEGSPGFNPQHDINTE